MTPSPRYGRAWRLRTQGGAILVQVAIALVVLVGLTSFVLDYGVMWTGRGQAQNAADAGALAGALSRAFDESGTPTPGGRTYAAAIGAASANQVFGESGGIVVGTDCPPWVDATRCVRVDVHRDGTNGSTALPAYFARLFGQTSQRVRATATAAAVPANTTTCLRPWAIPDKWLELRTPPWTDHSTYDRYDPKAKVPGALLPTPPPVDQYAYPGYTVDADRGTTVTLHFGGENDPIQNGWYLSVDIPRAGGGPLTGADRYNENIVSCNGIATTIGQYLSLEPGAMKGPTKKGFQDLYNQDKDAYWDDGIKNSCAPGPCGATSPRLIAIAAFDPDDFALRKIQNDRSACVASGLDGGRQCVHVVNIFGFFITGVVGDDVVGVLVTKMGEQTPGGDWTVNPGATFLWTVQLVQ